MTTTSSKCILLIEDEPIFRMNYRTVLENSGYRVLEADTGDSGFEKVRVENPDLVLLDLILPESNGYQTLNRIRTHSPSLPVIVLTVLSAENDEARAREAGANDFAVKGMEPPSAILDKIAKLL